MPDELTDDQINDAIAAEIVARIKATHKNLSPKFRRQLVSLYTRQALGIVPPPGRITDRQLGIWLDRDPRRLGEDRAQALARAWQAYQDRFPELS